jgi:trans-2-enoyl-CoA reductase
MQESRSVVFREFGDPVERAEIEVCEPPSPGPGEVLVRLLHAPINPADFNYIEGTYGLKPAAFPAAAGMEGSGEVVEVGAGVTDLRVGDRVAILSGAGCWQQLQVLPLSQVFVLPLGIDPEQGAMLKVNPPTAWMMLHRYGPPVPGSMVVQNLGNSNVGLSVIGLGRRLGIDVLSLVRSERAREQCVAAGAAADRVFIDSKEGLDEAREALGERRGVLGLNGVGGDSALRVMNLLGEKATLLTYGAMGRKPLKLPTGLLLFKGLRLEGFWLTRWIREHTAEEYHEVLGEAAAAMAEGDLRLPVVERFPFAEVKAALDRAREGGLGGKVLLDFRG